MRLGKAAELIKTAVPETLAYWRESGAPGWIRTSDLPLRRRLL
jgi:hypothetical protein